MTKLSYLDDTYTFEDTGTVQELGRDEKGGYLILDQTIFYPQGGGQPADKGFIRISGDDVPVSFVGFHDGRVRHYIPDTYFNQKYIGQLGALSVDQQQRELNARLHTAGHLVSHVIENLNENLIPVKGYHFNDGPYVEFLNERGVDVTALINGSNQQMATDIANTHAVSATLSDFPTISQLRPQLAPFIPKDKPSRIVTVGSYRSLPCGGTHVDNLKRLGSVKITKAKKQKENVRISYVLTEPL
ncbi:hypothetical protein DW352_03470 [Pseudolabrys taiwanensis]|uniref:Threonyl/alanyl tRNA synthetase SAD domain-containing protein n=1 Tax=Pseudolabrys taiwanensis TaxID=331696 RepID=A0A345ZRW1_9HYPH|nr:alanine--tRNA ligase-related protein [Pseudolabrys taiwanensis]AXK79658.1 hypothetical protein DW352_03470 [Pseudolabrys taiwanensis]